MRSGTRLAKGNDQITVYEVGTDSKGLPLFECGMAAIKGTESQFLAWGWRIIEY